MRLEEEYFAEVVSGNMRVLLPESYKGKTLTIWDELHTLYPGPASIKKLVDNFTPEQLHNSVLLLNYYSCVRFR